MKMYFPSSVFGLLLVACSLNAAYAIMTNESAMDYLKKYNYMGEESQIAEISDMPDDQAFGMVLEIFQSMHGLNVTGVLDEATSELMSMPRCGIPDFMPDGNMKRKKRFSAQGGSWPKTSLTYTITQYTPDMTRAQVDSEIRRAFDVWEMVTPLRFTYVSNPRNADIVILFGGIQHGDQFPFDGPGSTLAHAFFPDFGGDAHFDESETWTLNTFQGTNLFQVAAHEFGHSLGLGHSTINEALMAPFYRGYVPNFQLHSDDIRGIQSLYGGPVVNPAPTTTTTRRTTTRRTTVRRATQPRVTQTTPTTTPTTTTTVQPGFVDFCRDPIFNAITKHQTADGEVRTYVFKNDYYAEVDNNGVVSGFPKPISENWIGLPDNIDAALYWEPVYDTYWQYNYNTRRWEMRSQLKRTARTYFFKGDIYWRFQEGKMDSGYPRTISSGWGLPSNIDAAFVWGQNGKTYFMKDNVYYRYNSERGRLDRGYPKSITVWADEFKGGVDAVVSSGHDTFFFKGEQHYTLEYTNSGLNVASGYPRPNAVDTLGCNRIQSALESDHSGVSGSNSVHSLTGLVLTVLTLLAVLFIQKLSH